MLFLGARCLNQESDDVIVPKRWFSDSKTEQEDFLGNEHGESRPFDGCTTSEELKSEVVLNGYNSELNNNLLFSECKTWDELKAGVVPGRNKRYCLNILYPSHNNFEVYDVIVAVFVQGKRTEVWGYQLQEGQAPRKHQVNPDMHKSLFVQGSPQPKPKMMQKVGPFQARTLLTHFLANQDNTGRQNAGEISGRAPSSLRRTKLIHDAMMS